MGFRERGIEAALDGVAAAGFRNVEILGQEPHVSEPPAGEALAHFRQGLDARGFRLRSVHAPLGKHVLGAPDEAWRQEKLAVLESYVRFAGDIGAGTIVIHPVPNPMFVPCHGEPGLEERIGAATRRSLDELVPVARGAGVRLLLENLPYVCNYPFLTMAELRALVDGYPAEQVGLVIDSGHAAAVGRDPAEEIRIAGNRLWGTHLQDVDPAAGEDQHWAPTCGGLNWPAIRAALREVGYAGVWMFEVVYPHHGESNEEMARLTYEFATEWVAG